MVQNQYLSGLKNSGATGHAKAIIQLLAQMEFNKYYLPVDPCSSSVIQIRLVLSSMSNMKSVFIYHPGYTTCKDKDLGTDYLNSLYSTLSCS